MKCSNCHDQGWVCEDHPDKPWNPDDAQGQCCGGAGMPCAECNPCMAGVFPRLPPEHLTMAENIAQCEELIAGGKAWMAHISRLLEGLPIDEMYEATSGKEIQPQHPTSADTPRGLMRVATDGERNGRLAWVPGAR